MEYDSSKDVLDVRDLITRLEELEEMREPPEEFVRKRLTGELDEDDVAELKTLEELLSELKSSGGDEQWRGDWYPVTLIQDKYFEDYAKEYAEDCGLVKDDAQWPNNHIDWKKASEELQQDYSSVEFDGVTWWYR